MSFLFLAATNVDACTGCEIPCKTHASYPPGLTKEIDQSNMSSSVDKYHRHLCIGQPFSHSQWPANIKDLQGNYINELANILKDKKDSIGYKIKLTVTPISSKSDSENTADWYLFPDQIKLNNIHIKQIKDVVEQLFVNDQSVIKYKDQTKTIEEQIKQNNSLSKLNPKIKYEKLNGHWVLVCCHTQCDQRCGKFNQ